MIFLAHNFYFWGMKYRFLALFFMGTLLMLFGCRPSYGEGDAIEIPPGMEPMLGAWTTKAKRSVLVRIYPNGEAVIDVQGWPTLAGTFSFDSLQSNRLIMVTNSQLGCTNVRGIYDVQFSLDKQTAFLTLIEDECDMRMRRLRWPLTKVSEDANVPHP
jgi:hypothetical protein